MPNITRSALDALSLTNFPNNTSQLISPADLRDWLENGIDSFVTQKDSSRLENVIYENEGSDIAASATINLASATGNYLHITGAFNGITSFGTIPAGGRFVLVFDGICTLTYNATSLILPGGSNITTAAGDCAMLVSEGSGNWRMVGFFPISGGGGGGDITAVNAGTGLSGGGTSGSVTLDLGDTAVTPNSYTNANITVDQQGRITAASNGTPGGVTSVSGTAPISSTGGTTPAISISQASGSTDGYLSSGDWTTFNGKGNGTVTTTGTPSSGQITKFSGATSITNATAGSGGDYVAPGSATGSGLTMASSRLLGRTTASPNPGAIEEISLTTSGTSGAATLSGGTLNIPQYSGGGGSGTVNSGTANRLTYYAANGTAVSELPTAGSSGQILQSNGTGSAPSWVNAPPATLTIGSSIVGGATAGRLLLTTTSGANQVLNQDSNLNYDTTNDRLGIGVATPTGTLHLAAGVATNPQVLLVPSAITPTGTTNGSIWCNNVGGNTSLQFYKDSSLTRLVTIDRNPDLATSGTALLQADSNGTISKGSELTALGIYAQTNTPTAITTGSGSLIGTVTGVTALPANFFGTGKTIAFYLSGLISMANSGGPVVAIDFRITDGTTTVTLGTLSYDTTNLTNRVYVIDTSITCRSSGSNPVFGVAGKMIVNHTAKSQETVFITPAAVTATSLNTSSALTLQIVATWTNPNTTSSISSIVNYCHYLN